MTILCSSIVCGSNALGERGGGVLKIPPIDFLLLPRRLLIEAGALFGVDIACGDPTALDLLRVIGDPKLAIDFLEPRFFWIGDGSATGDIVKSILVPLAVGVDSDGKNLDTVPSSIGDAAFSFGDSNAYTCWVAAGLPALGVSCETFGHTALDSESVSIEVALPDRVSRASSPEIEYLSKVSMGMWLS
jgi:hypothetical protein